MDTEKRKPGRPVGALPVALTARFVDWIASGRTLRAFAAAEGISEAVLYKWAEKDAKFRREVAEARQHGHDRLAEEALEIADASEPERVAVDRLRIDTRRWLLSRWSPERYGEAKASPSSGATVVVVTGVPRSEISDPRSENRETTPTPGRSPLAASRAGGEEHNTPDTQISPNTHISISNTPSEPAQPRLTVEIDPPVSEGPPLEESP